MDEKKEKKEGRIMHLIINNQKMSSRKDCKKMQTSKKKATVKSLQK